MENKEIRISGRNIKDHAFDSLLFFSLITCIIQAVSKIIPIVGSAFVSPLEYSKYDVFERGEHYTRVTTNDFMKFFRFQWHRSFAYKARSFYYAIKPLLIAIIVGLASSLFMLLFALFAVQTGNFNSLYAVFGTLSIFTVIYFIALSICVFLLIPRSMSTYIGMFVIYKNPTIDSNTALLKSIEIMNGNRLSLLCFTLCLIPDFIKSLFFGYGLPAVNNCYYHFCKNIYYEYKNNHSNCGLDEIPLTDICPICGTIKRDDSKFCRRCGSEF